jgi:hypothetical protein
MKKLLLLLPLTFLPLPAQAITWGEFWAPFTPGRVYVREYPVYRRYIPMCDRPIIREEYVPGNYWRSGYVRHWTEWVRVACDDYDY